MLKKQKKNVVIFLSDQICITLGSLANPVYIIHTVVGFDFSNFFSYDI